MKLTQEFLDACNVCSDGQKVAIDSNYIGMEYDEVIKDLVARGLKEDAGWMLDHKKTEVYVKSNGSIFTMDSYQVFNPTTGTHKRCATEEEANLAFLEVIKSVIAHAAPVVNGELINEKGDATWVPIDFISKLDITIR